MRVAIAYDWLNIKIGGGEQTLFEIAKLYPNADIVCLIYNKKKFDDYLGGRTIITSRLNAFPKFIKNKPSLLLPFIRKSVEELNFDNYDLVISVSSAWVKNINVPKHTCHISYCYSPARMLWDSWPKYLDTQTIGPFKLGRISHYKITRIVSKLRLWDYYQSKNVYSFIAISDYIAGRITKYYHRSSSIVYPPVKLQNLQEGTIREHYLCISSLSRYKNLDVVIKAFRKNGLPLTIAGDGPDKDRLEKLASKANNVQLVGRVDDNEKQKLLQTAKAFIFPSIEDFGIAPVEALSAGTPVIALRGGGLLETVSNGKTGIFFDSPTAESLNKAIQDFKKISFDAKKVSESVQKFSEANFAKQFPISIKTIYKKWQHEQTH
jgi:glycosyltransferase involved in cell wall biosynthesis